jgi:hypothetical protein
MLEFRQDLTNDQIPEDLRANDLEKAQLHIRLSYRKDGRRGLKLSITRCGISENFTRTMPFSKYNGLLHVQDMKRKNDKIMQAMGDKIEANLDRIAEVSLASETPNWQDIFNLLEDAA